MKISLGKSFAFLRSSIVIAMALSILGCGDSGPSDGVIVSDVTDRLKKYTYDRNKFTDDYDIKSVEVVGRRMEGDTLTAVVKITVACKTTINAMYTFDVLGMENECVRVGVIRSNELNVKYAKFDSGWRQQTR